MMWRVKLLLRAEEDLLDIWLSIALHNEAAADRLLDQIKERWYLLADHPHAGPARDDIASGIRHLVIGEYLTFYRIVDGAVEILRVLHGRRDISGTDIGP